jgi:hypothetical protein
MLGVGAKKRKRNGQSRKKYDTLKKFQKEEPQTLNISRTFQSFNQ